MALDQRLGGCLGAARVSDPPVHTKRNAVRCLITPGMRCHPREGEPRKPQLHEQVRQRIRVTHDSLRTERSRVAWIRRFILANSKRDPAQTGISRSRRFSSHWPPSGRSSPVPASGAVGTAVALAGDALHRAALAGGRDPGEATPPGIMLATTFVTGSLSCCRGRGNPAAWCVVRPPVRSTDRHARQASRPKRVSFSSHACVQRAGASLTRPMRVTLTGPTPQNCRMVRLIWLTPASR